MQPVKRLEIVVDAAHAPRILDALRHAGARGYTVLKDAAGSGERGEREGDELGAAAGNHIIVCALSPAIVPTAVEAIRPLLKRWGGMCLVSDALWVRHTDHD